MSDFIGAALATNPLGPNDTRILSLKYIEQTYPSMLAWADTRVGSFTTTHWPGTSGLQGDADIYAGDADWWGQPDVTRGSARRFGIVGVTRDVYGSPLPFCTVKIYRTSTDEMCGSTVSDGNGAYTVTTPYYPDAHYVVVYKAGSPDTFGTTANSLVPG